VQPVLPSEAGAATAALEMLKFARQIIRATHHGDPRAQVVKF
jgi:hypothetical protein